MRVKVKVLNVPRQKNPTALARSFRFGNERFSAFVCFELLPEVTRLSGQEPCLREKLIFIRESFRHACQVPSEVVFPRQSIHAWEVIDPLVGLHIIQAVDSCLPTVLPIDVTLSAFVWAIVGRQAHFELPFAHETHHVVLGLAHVEYKFLLSLLVFLFALLLRYFSLPTLD